MYSEKATKFCEIFTLLLFYVVPVKSKVKISQNFVAFSEYMNFKHLDASWFHEFSFLNPESAQIFQSIALFFQN